VSRRAVSLYARAGIADYWIVNIPDRRLEVYREPVPDAAVVFGWRHGQVLTLVADGRVAPLAAPSPSLTCCRSDVGGPKGPQPLSLVSRRLAVRWSNRIE
jgi:hypothetical protein